MAKADECLFLLEVLIDKIIFVRSPCFSDKEFKTCVSFDFLSLAPLEICDDERDDCAAPCGGPFIKDFNSGKSCLFALKDADIEKAMSSFPINVTVFKSLPCGCLPTKIIMGNCTIDMTKEFVEARKKYLNDPDSVSYQSLKDSFRLSAPDNSETGDVLLFLRISCFGKLIITKFQGGGMDTAMCPTSSGGNKECSPKKEWRRIDDPCYCGSKKSLAAGRSFGAFGSSGGSGRGGACPPPETATPCMDPDDPCYCSGAKSPVATAAACRNTEAYCLHVPKGGGGATNFEEMGTCLTGNDLKIKIPKTACLIKKISQTHTKMQRPYGGGKGGECEAPCAKNQISLDLPPNQLCCAGAKQQISQYTCVTEGCATVGKHGTGGCNVIPKNVPGAAVATTKLHPNKDVFVLRVAKTSSHGDKKTKLELELVTPKGVEKKIPVRLDTREAQCDPECKPKCCMPCCRPCCKPCCKPKKCTF